MLSLDEFRDQGAYIFLDFFLLTWKPVLLGPPERP